MKPTAVNPERYKYSRYFVFLLFFLAGSTAAYAIPDTIKYTGSSTFCQGQSLLLTANPPGTTYQWQLNGSNVSTASSYTVTQSGTVTVTVNGTPYQPLPIIVNPNPVANFTFSPNNQCGSVPISFANTSTGAGLSYLWNFNDPNSGTNNTSTATNPVHKFIGTPGNGNQSFNVQLTVTSSDGCTNTKALLVTIKQSPSTQLGGDGYLIYTDGLPYFTQCTSTASLFTFTNQAASFSTNTSYKIIWGDGLQDYIVTSFTTITHTYNVGIYSLQFIVNGINGCSDTGNYKVFVGSNPAVGLGTPGNTNICTNSQLTFPITGTALNPIGTLYTVSFNDPNNVFNFQHPVPDSINHIFLINSCGYSSPGSNGANSFYAKIVAANPCGVSEGTVLPIHVSQKPTAAITILPKDTVCVNNPVTLTSSSSAITNVSTTGVCTAGKIVWQISPSAGWTVTSGSLGNDFNSNNLSGWISGSSGPIINFNTPGSYTIKLKVGGNPNCGLDSITKTICVNPAPIGNFTLDNNTGCAPLTIAATNTSNSPICGTNTYAWTVAYTPTAGCLPNTAGFIFAGGTNANSQDPQFQFTNPGIYTISLVTKSSNGACTAPTVSKTVTVKAKPVVTITASATICENGTISPTSASTCYINATTTYAWTFIGGVPASSTLANPGNITYATPGTYAIELAVTNECGTTIATKTLTVFQKPSVNTIPNDTVCRGATVPSYVLSSSVSGTTFMWTNNNTLIGLSAGGPGNVPGFTAANSTANPITATITITPTNGCIGTPMTFTITVYPTPLAPTGTTPVTYCQNAVAIPLTAIAAANHTLNWYTVATGGTASAMAPSPLTTTVGSINYYVSQTNAGGCEGPRTTIVVTVNASPVIATAVPANPTSCATSTGFITITGLIPNTLYTVTYTKNGTPVTINLTSNASGNIIIPSLGSGTYDNIKVTRLGCPSNVLGPISLVDPNPPATPTAGSSSPVCSGGTLSLTANTIAGATYTWSGPGFTSNQQNPNISNVTTAASGNYSVTVTVNGCTSAAGTVTAVVNPTPANITAASNSPLCSGDTLKLTSSSTTTGAVTYDWTGPNSFTDNVQNPVIPNATVAASGTYSVIAKLGNCSAAPKTVNATVRPTPVITDSSFTNPSTCISSTGSISLMGLASSTSYTVNYLKNGVSATITLSSNATGVLTLLNLTPGTYSNITLTLNTCISRSIGPFVLVAPNPPATPTAGSNSPVCVGNPINLTATTTTGGTVTYNWNGPNGFLSSLQNPVIPNATVAASGNYTVTATVNGCTSQPATIAVVINPSPANVTAAGNSPLCSGDTLKLTSSSTTTGAVAYIWTGPNGFTSNSQNPNVPNATTAASGIYSVTATLGNCNAAPITINVTVRPTPVITDSSFINPSSCTSSTGSISLTGLANSTSYIVNYLKNGVPVTVILSSNATGIITLLNLSPGTYSNITVTSNTCVSRSVGPFSLVAPNPPATPTAGSNSPVCIGNPLNLTATTTTAGTITYNWTGPNSFISSLQNPVIANPTVAASGNYIVTATINGCTSPAATVAVVVSPNAAIANAGPDQQLCNNSTALLAGNNAGNGTGTWTVIAPSPAIVSQINNPVSGISNLPTGITKLVWTINNNVCLPTSDTVQITNLPTVINIINPLSNTICSGQSITLNGGNPTGGSGTSYTIQWEQSSNNIFYSPTGITTASLTVSPTATTYYRRKIISGVCINYSDTALITVLPGITNNTINSNQSICINTVPALLSGSAPAGGGSTFGYSWDSSYNGITWNPVTIANGQNFQPGALTVTTQFRRRVSTASCSGAQASISNIITITVNPDARAVFNPTDTVGCVPFNITQAVINLTPFNNAVIQYFWYVNGNLWSPNQAFPTYTMNTPGDTATIKLVAISRFGCKNDSVQHGFKTIIRPVPAFNQSDSVGCGPLSITFTNLTPNAALYTYQWIFGTGATSTLQQPGAINFPTHPQGGDTVYTVKFIAISQCNRDTLIRYVRVKAKPKALFTPDKTTGCSSYNFTFTNTSRTSGTTTYVWDFGDGSPLLPSNAAQVNHMYTVGITTTFRVKLKATNECGTDSLIYNLVVTPITIRPDFAINGNQQFGCLPHTVKFINNSQGATFYSLNFGDGSPIVSGFNGVDTITHTYTDTGTFIVRLHATNSCSDTMDVEVITVQKKPSVSFTASTLLACTADTIRFTNLSDTGISYNWRFGDGGTALIRNPVHVYNTGNTFRVWLTGTTVYAGGSCADSAFKDVVIRDTLPGSFTAGTVAATCLPVSIPFVNDNRPAALTTWTFGDGGTGIGDSVNHTYTQAGIYIVKMVSKGIGGCTYGATKTITVSGLSGTLLYNSGYLCPGVPLHMEVLTNNIAQIKYVFGNGDSLTTTNTIINYTYPQPGIYIPYAEMTSGACKIRLTRGDTVKVDRLRTGFRTQIQQSCGKTIVAFTDTSSAFFGIRTWQWDFGDSTVSTLQNPVKTYTQSGTYSIKLRITSNSNCVDTITIPLSIIVHNYPVSTISGDSTPCIGQSLSFIAIVQSADPVIAYNWDFGNSTFGTGQTVTATYNAAGVYTARLISRTAFGCADTVYKTVRVTAAPQINVNPHTITICSGSSTPLFATGAAAWQWSPAQNLTCTTCPNPIASPAYSTTYIVTGSNSALCRASDTVRIEVIQRLNITVSDSAKICLPSDNSVQLFASGAHTYTWSPAGTLSNPNIPNPIASPTTTTVYQVIGKDNYNCFTDTDYVTVNVGRNPVVNLGNDRTVTAGDTVVLNPIITNGPITRYTWTPVTGLNFANIPHPVATINKDISYMVSVTNTLGCVGNDTINFNVVCDKGKQLYVPNAFSPDGDGKNDVFMIRGIGIEGVKYLRIFNRFGQAVFERYNISANVLQQGWDGTINGVRAQPDVYIVIAEVICTGGGTFSYQGNLTLMRF